MHANPTSSTKPRSAALRLMPLALALAISQAYGATPEGQDGLAGAHGATPGAPGGNGGNGTDGIASVVNGPSIVTRGGYGGNGGNGAAGTPNGAAGSGGNGGNAVSTTILSGPAFTTDRFRAVGGNGGGAGSPGNAPGMPGLQGRAGNGGNATLVHQLTDGDSYSGGGWVIGGDAGGGPASHEAGNGGSAQATLAYSTARLARVYASVVGGNAKLWNSPTRNGGQGGDARLELAASSAQVDLDGAVQGGNGSDAQGGPGTSAGNGGAAVARLSGSAQDSLTTKLTVQGGNGGNGTLGANGGHGADVAVGLPIDVSRTSGPIDIAVTGTGGAGGSSTGGRAGKAGAASVTLEVNAPRATSVKITAAAQGGAGGSMYSLPGSAAVATPTVGAIARTDLKVVATGALKLDASAKGGKAAGKSMDAAPPGNGVAGGDAISNIVATTDTALQSSAISLAQGGDGGDAAGAGHVAGKGGVGTSRTAVVNGGNGSLDLLATSRGGDGGVGTGGARSGDGGDAVAIDAVSGVTNGELYLYQDARAGDGGYGWGPTPYASGGNAISRLTLTDERSSGIRATVLATGGASNDGYSRNRLEMGNAEAALTLESTRAGTAVTGTSSASIYSASYSATGANTAVARTVVTARGDATSTAAAASQFSSGSLDAFARARSAMSATAVSSATGSSSTGLARSRAEADAAGGPANATASAISANAQSVAVAQGDGGSAAATSKSWAVNRTSVIVTASASAPVQGETVARAETNAVDQLYAVDGPSIANGARSAVSAQPGNQAAAAVFADASRVSAVFATANLFGVGVMEGASTGGDTTTYAASANFTFDSGYRHLRLGLFDAFTEGDGLQRFALTISDNGTQLFSRTFASAAEAQDYFDDTVLSLHTIGTRDDHQLLLSTSYTYTGAGAFGFGYVLGISAVPEPATWTLMLAGLTMVLVRRRSRA